MSPRQMAELFPFHLVFDRGMRLRQIGHSLQKVLPAFQADTDLSTLVTLERPLISLRYADVLEHIGSLFLLSIPEGRLRLRGQMVPLPGGDSIVFLCSPWLPEPGEFRTTGLTFDDFPLHDSMPEFMNVVQSQRLGMEDLRKLSGKLRKQREALKDVNQRLVEQSGEARKLALIAARTDNGVVITDALGRVEWVNQAFERTTGYTLAEMAGRTPGSRLQGPDTDPATVAHIRNQLRLGQGFTCELVNYTKAGSKYWVAIEVQPIRDESGTVTNFMAIENDVTARKETEFRRNLAYAATTILAEATDTAEALHKLLQTIVESIGYQFGVVWRVNQASGTLYPVRIWSRPELRDSWFEVETRNQTFERGAGLPGRVWELNGPHWIPDLAKESGFARRDCAARDGLRSGFAFPIRVGGEARGAMEFFSCASERPDDELLRTLTALGNQIGQFMERQDAEAERRRLVSLLNSTLESTTDGILAMDLHRRFVVWNQRLLRIWSVDSAAFARTPEEVLGIATRLVSNPDEFARRIRWWFEHPTESGEDIVHLRDGRVFRRTTQPQIAEGTVIGRIWNFREITESWRAEQALRESEEQYRVITSTASDGIVTVNTDNVILFANEAAERIFDYPSGTLVNLPFYEIMGDAYRKMGAKGLLHTVHQSRGPEGLKSVEIVGRRRDGEQIPLEVSFGRSRIGGQRVFTGVIRDITARRQAEERLMQAMLEIEAANRAKSDFLASISHEIRTPLNSIAGLSELLRDTRLNDDQRDMVNTIWTGSESLLNLINDLLDFSKIEAGQVEIANEEFDPLAVCERAVEIAKSRAHRKGLALVCTVHPGPSPRMVGDANRISQILLNLIINGIKFTESGSVSLDLRWNVTQPGRAMVDFVVRDTGIGISPEDRGRVFEKFYRIDTQVGRRAGGTGLGLSIARLLAERMGGSLTLEPAEEFGSCFRLHLDLPVSGEAVLTPSARSHAAALLLTRVENASLLTETWESIGVALVPFTGLPAASAYLDADRPCDFVLLDGEAEFDAAELKRFFRLLALRGRSRCIHIRPPDATGEPVSISAGQVVTIDFPLTPGRMESALQKVLDGAAEIPEVAPADEKERDALPPPVRARILLVEDNPDSQAYAARVFHKAGHNLTIAGTVAETLRSIKSGQFDVIFMDVMLPDGSGFDAAGAIRDFERTGGLERAPIVALTANAMQEYRERAFEADMDDYLTKPVRPEALLSAVRKWAKPHQAAMPDGEEPRATRTPELPKPAGVESNNEVLQIDPDMADLIPDYLVRVRKSLDEVARLAEAGDPEAIRRTGHNLKGSGAAYGFPEISRAGKVIEDAGREGNGEAAARAALELNTYLERVRWESGPA